MGDWMNCKTTGLLLLGLVIGLLLGGCGPATGPRTTAKGMLMSDRSPASRASIIDGVERFRLANGLDILVKENHSTPVVAVVTYVKTGYFNEPDQLSGISHVIEHMYFNGTPSRPGPEDIGRETKGYGGNLNAGTIYDHTSYYVVLPSARWREALEVQADAFQNPLFDREVLDNEMEAILQEARRKLDNPVAYGREKMFELAFTKHRMRRWRIGTEEGLRALNRDDIQRFYEDHYRPENTVLVVVGDVDASEIEVEIEKLYGDQPEGHLRKHSGPAEPPQEDFRYERLHGDLQRNYLFVGYHVPGERHRDNAALDVLSTILGAGNSSRLVGRLKEDLGAVTSIYASSYRFDDVGIFEIDAICGTDDLDRASREIFVEVERMKLYGPTEEELDRARSILETSEEMSREEVLGQANSLAHYEALGDYHLLEEELEALRTVTADDVQRVANEYLVLDNATLLEYCPPFIIGGREPGEMREHIHGAVLAGVRSMTEPEAPPEAPSYLPREELASWATRFESDPSTSGKLSRFDLPTGGVLLVNENHATPTVAAGAYFRGGRIGEFNNNTGLTRLMQRMMVKQTNNRDQRQLATEIEGLGTGIGRISSDDYLGFSISGLRRNLPYSFDVLFDVVANPRFDIPQLSREKEALISTIDGVQDQSGALAFDLLRRATFGEHPYGLPEFGAKGILKYIDISRVEDQHAELIRPENLCLVISGDVDPGLVHEFVLRYVERWKMGGDPLPNTAASFYTKERYPTVAPLLNVHEESVQKDRSQTAIAMAYPTVNRMSLDRYPLRVLQSITGGMGGTFFEEIRGRHGLAYQVSTFAASYAMGGEFGVFVACSPDSAERVRELVRTLCNGLATEPPTDEFLRRAKNYLIGSYQVGLQTNRAQMGSLAGLELLGIDLREYDRYPERIEAVSRQDLERVARSYFLDKPYAIGIVAGAPGGAATPR